MRSNSDDPTDLLPSVEVAWRQLAVPDGWRAVASLCEEVADDANAVVTRVLQRITAEISSYDEHSAVRPEDLRSSIEGNLEMMLVGLAQHRGPLPAELAVRRELGRRRARQGLPVDALLEAFVVGYRELWDELVLRSRDHDGHTRELLLSGASMIWQWVHEVTEVVRRSYQDQRRREDAATYTLRTRFLEELLTGELASEVLPELARRLQLDPLSHFQAICIRASDPATVTMQRTSHALREASGRCIPFASQGGVIVLAQQTKVKPLVNGLSAALGDQPMGIGLCREGLIGARLSIGDAERAACSQAAEEPQAGLNAIGKPPSC